MMYRIRVINKQTGVITIISKRATNLKSIKKWCTLNNSLAESHTWTLVQE